MSKNFIIKCPHCDDFIEIVEINCAIFRHGCYKNNGTQINPHANKDECDRLLNQNLIYGCSKPFRIIQKQNSTEHEAIICDYI